jgi:hypothetical protein
MELYAAAENIIKTEIDNYVDFRLFLETIGVAHVREALLANLAYKFTENIGLNNKNMCKVIEVGRVKNSQAYVEQLLAKRMKIEYYETDDCERFYNMILLNKNLKKVRLTDVTFDNGMTIERKDVKCYFIIKTPEVMANFCKYYTEKRNNIFVKIYATEGDLLKYEQGNVFIYTIDLTNCESDITIPKKFTDLRNIHINCEAKKDITITVNGFKKLEYIFIHSNSKHLVTLNVSNVPYLMVAEIYGQHIKNIDNKTVNLYSA